MGNARKSGFLDGQKQADYYPRYGGILDTSKAKHAGPDVPLPAVTPAAPPAKLNDPVRGLTESEARDIAKYLWERNEFSFPNQSAKGWSFPGLNRPTKAADGTISWSGQLMLNNVIGGVQFINDYNTKADIVFGPGWRILVLACRMAKFVLSEFGGPAMIFHKGFAGKGTIQTNRHNRGVAFDFSGASTSQGSFIVKRNWGDKPVPDALGGVQGKWPPGFVFTNARYRLNPQADQAAYNFFLKMYNFAISECNDGSTKNPLALLPPHQPGWNGTVIHPDYGIEGGDDGRLAHNDHIHMDVNEEFAP